MANIPVSSYENNEALAGTDIAEVVQPLSGGARREKKASLTSLQTFYQGTLPAEITALQTDMDNIKYEGDPIETSDFLIPVNGIKDSHNNRAIQKKISWNPYEDWKTASVTGDIRFNRGEAGVFGAYENLWQTPALVSASSTIVGEWTKVENTATASGRLTQTLATAQDEVSCQFMAKKGATDLFRFKVTLAGSGTLVTFDFSTGTFSTTSGYDSLEAFEVVANDTYLIKLTKTGTASGTDSFDLFASGAAVSGEYTYYKDVSYVGGIDYPVPYVKGTHSADSWIHPVCWNESTDWTIDVWFKPESTTASATYVLDTRGFVGDVNFIIVRYSGSTLALLAGNGSTTTQNFSAFPTVGQYSHIRVVATLGTQARAYLNSVLVATINTNVPTKLSPTLILGDDVNGIASLNGYFADIMIRPTLDLTTTHYDSGLPWTNPDDIVSTERGYGLDENGHMRVRTLTATEEDVYSIVDQYTIGDQTVTKWSNGDMEIQHNTDLGSVAITTADNNLFRSAGITPSNYIEFFVSSSILDINIITSVMGDSSGIWSKAFTNALTRPAIYNLMSPSSVTINAVYRAVSKGKWK